MNQNLTDVEPMVYRSRINVPYSWWAGDTASQFFIALRDEKKIMGKKCAGCSRTYVPPRKVCPLCFTENAEWVEVASEGSLQSYTICRRQLAALPRKAPVVFGLIRLDGADTALLHYLDEVDPERVRIGMRVEARFADERTGGIGDIAYFRPAK
jgi:uncharacterized OB-fold protein